MKLDVTEEEYLAAVSDACELIDIILSNSSKPLSGADADLKQFVAAIYDTVIPCDALGTLMKSNEKRRNTLLVLLVGRCKYGRPRHDRADDMLAWGFECQKEGQQ